MNQLLETIFTTYFGVALIIWVLLAVYLAGTTIINIMEMNDESK